MTRRLKRAAKVRKQKPPTGRAALSRVRSLISRNRLTLARIQRMNLQEMLTLATVLKAAHNTSTDPEEQSNIKIIIGFINQTAQEKYGSS